jgi:hypothetical protein
VVRLILGPYEVEGMVRNHGIDEALEISERTAV